LQSGKIFLSEEEVKFLIKNYNNKGQVGYKQFLSDMRGKMNESRYKSIVDAYKRVGKIVGNKITL